MSTTTFSVSYKNATINALTGRAANSSPLTYVAPYPGTMAVDPSTTPGLPVSFSPASNGPSIAGFMTQAALGISTLSGPRLSGGVASTGGTMTVARIFDATPTAMIDTTLTNAGGGGGAISATLTYSLGTNWQLDSMSLKMPFSNGTVLWNEALADAMVSIWTIAAANVAALSGAVCILYTGSAPATADLPPTGTPLVSFTTAAAGATWNSASSGSAALAGTITTLAAAASGTATYARFTKGAYTLQCSVGTSGTDMIINTTTIVAGTTYSITSLTITL